MSDPARKFTKYTIWGVGTTDTLIVEWPVGPQPDDNWHLTLHVGKGTTGLQREDVEELQKLLTLFLGRPS